jgi:hypothetical protein
VLDWAKSRRIGFSHMVSLGEHADVDFGDLLDHLASEPRTRSILLYIESIEDARKFMSAARCGGAQQAGRRRQGRPGRPWRAGRRFAHRRASRLRHRLRRRDPTRRHAARRHACKTSSWRPRRWPASARTRTAR